jgi:pimeloyl-ACP methyl ester carboxylesterase
MNMGDISPPFFFAICYPPRLFAYGRIEAGNRRRIKGDGLMAELPETSIELDETQLTYVEAGSGQPVIFIHGGLGDYRVWSSQMEPFSKRYHVIAYSRRYAWPNKSKGDYSGDNIPENAQDLAGLIDKLGLAPAHIIGHSYGAFTALWFAKQHQERIRTMVLAEPPVLSLLIKNPYSPLDLLRLLLKRPSVGLSFMKFGARTMMPMEKASKRGDYERAARIFLDGIICQKDTFAALPPDLKQIVVDNTEALKGEGEFPLFTCEDAGKITVPTLALQAELTPSWFGCIVDILAECLPGSETYTIPNVSHAMHMKEPDAFNSKVLEFIGKHS